MEKDDCDWKKIMARISDPDIDPKEVAALTAVNRTAAFYMSVRGLIDRAEVDIDMLRSLFGYNYTRYWNCLRKRIRDASSDDMDEGLFEPIDELRISEEPCTCEEFLKTYLSQSSANQ
jgi:hypothetical protein